MERDIFYKPPMTTFTFGIDKELADKFKSSYPRLSGRIFKCVVRNCLKSRHFTENILFSDIDSNGNFIDSLEVF